MEILNVGAGRTDEQYEEAQKQHIADLRADSRSCAQYFFWAAGLAALGTGVFFIQLNIAVSIGAIDLLTRYGKSLGAHHQLASYLAAVAWVLLTLGLGFAARRGHRWAFLAGIALYAADMVALIVMFSIWAFGLHAFFLFKWFQGQQALKDLEQATLTRVKASAA